MARCQTTMPGGVGMAVCIDRIFRKPRRTGVHGKIRDVASFLWTAVVRLAKKVG